MPLYLVSHAQDLTDEQRDRLAQGITKIHTSIFTAPSLFVNVRFSPASQYVGYVGGKRSTVSSITGHVRHGPSRTQVMYDELTSSISKLWAETVESDRDIRIFIMGDIVAGYEQGVSLPPAGGDKVWLKNNLPYFEKKAAEGNQQMKDLLEEIKERKLLDWSPVADEIVRKE
ncbi:uncharacterized protein PV09_06713 [Verruconis gallopava]|uniref:Tautomerase cis-CaaD-like domain-containing protein n=1 Tax=Verruconis gallopava TaxID=253628 RepID=A0A0D2ARP6_9PEZI|nr:uncharacterized protein PV09_06713 [Verruconis gallopava]KIW01864.1 hypothetical protein PV09_06713 [Verruconis gallopava]